MGVCVPLVCMSVLNRIECSAGDWGGGGGGVFKWLLKAKIKVVGWYLVVRWIVRIWSDKLLSFFLELLCFACIKKNILNDSSS